MSRKTENRLLGVGSSDDEREAHIRHELITEHYFPDCHCDRCALCRLLDKARAEVAQLKTDLADMTAGFEAVEHDSRENAQKYKKAKAEIARLTEERDSLARNLLKLQDEYNVLTAPLSVMERQQAFALSEPNDSDKRRGTSLWEALCGETLLGAMKLGSEERRHIIAICGAAIHSARWSAEREATTAGQARYDALKHDTENMVRLAAEGATAAERERVLALCDEYEHVADELIERIREPKP